MRRVEKKGRWKLRAYLFGSGLVMLAVGFIVLSQINPRGDNWASILSPILIISSYIIIAISLLVKGGRK
ncbi:hypothetical protein LR007_03280 [candidate division NPL-UPA2 bacterium]|nr:hypothetical protein [candidate division NPL-UPA2 bacterium]